MSILSIRDLSVTFKLPKEEVQALRSVSWDLNEGEILGIVGESGSGKTVSTLSLLRLLPANAIIESGSILYKDENILDFDKRRLQSFRNQAIGYIFQEPSRSYDPIYSIEKTFAETFRVQDPAITREEIRARTIALLREVHIPRPEQRLHNIPAQFSGGMLQRIMIALALSRKPHILIADEPTTALDVTIEAEIIDLMLDLQKKHGLSIIFVSHNIALVLSIADRILVMKDGEIVEQNTAEDILAQPQHEYTQYLLNSVISAEHIREQKGHVNATKHL